MIDINELERLLEILLANIRACKGEMIQLKSDYYWSIIFEQKYDVYENPTDLTVGQISDDYAELKRLLKNSDDFIGYDLKRVSEILSAMSKEFC